MSHKGELQTLTKLSMRHHVCPRETCCAIISETIITMLMSEGITNCGVTYYVSIIVLISFVIQGAYLLQITCYKTIVQCLMTFGLSRRVQTIGNPIFSPHVTTNLSKMSPLYDTLCCLLHIKVISKPL